VSDVAGGGGSFDDDANLLTRPPHPADLAREPLVELVVVG
jgi:hypothetical protein